MTDAQYFMGIDGGGSTVRVAIITPEMQLCGEAHGGTANPGVVGANTAMHTIRTALHDALTAAQLTPAQIAAVGIGVAGAAAHHSADWLRDVVAGVTPDAHIIPSADFEIALVGALGERRGVLLLAGTGSLAYGANAAGHTALVGGWGYLLDDAGSGYWIGKQALNAVARARDGRSPDTALVEHILSHFGLHKPLDLVPWLYHTDTARTREVAALAPLVLTCADAGDAVAQQIIDHACDELALAAHTVIRRLELQSPGIAFAGGLLTTPNRLSTRVCAALDLPSIPEPRYPPVIGAALLARLALA
ncbi:MAG: hypothetical protein K8S97_09165 [Anaerolineae bacterium]|nr:hypothetical protein [Anaerolineae bacterium]